MISDLFSLSQATLITIKLALCSLILGLVIGMIFAAWESSRYKWFASIATTLVTLIRGLPEILVVLSIYFSAPYILILLSDGFTIPLYFTSIHVQMNIQSFDVSPFGCGVVALSLLYAAYSSQTLRGALKSVSHGQKESALALGLPVITIYRRIILPQMWQHALPGLGNQWLVLLKDTALVSLIAVNDIMMQTKSIITRTNDPVGPFNGYLIAAAIYLVITLISQYILKRIEQRVTHFEKVSS